VTEEHFSAAISTLNPNRFSDLRNLAIFMLAFDSGARLSELINLKVGDVDLLQRCAKVMGKGEGRESSSLASSQLKPSGNTFCGEPCF